MIAPLSKDQVRIRKNFDEIERVKKHLKTKQITVDGVIQSLQPCARVYLSADQDDIGTTTYIVQFDSESYDVGNNFDTTTSSFTAAIAGYYQVNASIYFEGADLGADVQYGLAIRKNANEYSRTIIHSSSATELSVVLSDIVPLAIGNTISLYYLSADSNVDIESGATFTFMSIRLVQ